MEQPGFSEKLAALPKPHDLPSLRQALRQLSRAHSNTHNTLIPAAHCAIL